MLDLFTPRVPHQRLHPVFSLLLQPKHEPERQVLQDWAEGFLDRDGKFVIEFQTTFESSLWELYLHACLRELNLSVNFSFNAPDFVIERPSNLTIEATIAAPPRGGKKAYNYQPEDIPSDFNEFNREAALRICNSFDSKVKKYREEYSKLPQSIDPWRILPQVDQYWRLCTVDIMMKN
jgi:hypothetical protein